MVKLKTFKYVLLLLGGISILVNSSFAVMVSVVKNGTPEYDCADKYFSEISTLVNSIKSEKDPVVLKVRIDD